MRMHNNININN